MYPHTQHPEHDLLNVLFLPGPAQSIDTIPSPWSEWLWATSIGGRYFQDDGIVSHHSDREWRQKVWSLVEPLKSACRVQRHWREHSPEITPFQLQNPKTYIPCSFVANQDLHSWSSCRGKIQHRRRIGQVLQTTSHQNKGCDYGSHSQTGNMINYFYESLSSSQNVFLSNKQVTNSECQRNLLF